VLVEHHAAPLRPGRRGRGHGIAVERRRPRQQNESAARLLHAQVAVSQKNVVLLLEQAGAGGDDGAGLDRRERRLEGKADGQVVGDALSDPVAVSSTAQPLTLIRT